jgi:hypothetical protein
VQLKRCRDIESGAGASPPLAVRVDELSVGDGGISVSPSSAESEFCRHDIAFVLPQSCAHWV